MAEGQHAHHFQREFAKARANPGRGWVVVWTQFVDSSGATAWLQPVFTTRYREHAAP